MLSSLGIWLLRYFYHVLQSSARSCKRGFAHSFLISVRKLNPDKVLYDVSYHSVEQQFEDQKHIWFFIFMVQF